MGKQPTCEERIESELDDRVDQLRGIFGRIDAQLEPDSEEADEELYSLALSIEEQKTYRIVLSTGGPHDELVVTVADGDIVEARYVFQDWFDGAQRVVPISLDHFEPIRRYCDQMVEAMG